MQAEINIGLFGHVDHGKTTLTKAMSGKWTDTHSEELKRGISIRLGYANMSIYFCKSCKSYGNSEKCTCGGKAEFKRTISFVDSPGHETLMTTAISASSIIDGALFLIAANEKCPQPQTAEHLMILNATGVKKVVVVQTKLDLVSKERAVEHMNEIKEFLKGSVAENAPIIPVIATQDVNVDALFAAIEKTIPTPERNLKDSPRLYISRSFDINKPGTEIPKLKGGVLGGSLSQGVLKDGAEVELRPGIQKKEGSPPEPLKFKISGLRSEGEELKEATPGGLIAIGTTLDPSLTKSDVLVGSVIGLSGELPETSNTVSIKYNLLARTDIDNPPLKMAEAIVVSVQTATSVGVISNLSKGIATIKLKRPICIDKGSKAALSRRIGQRWRLSGWGIVT
ncbi:translation initiation factor IF-2 subunit gamma [Candidatus Micrarchaeota archaeon]|nr:translation initiation factor IF-2 subunit gamma [Candidatus Micrarchaeota archaeon]